MRILPIIMADAIGGFVTAAAAQQAPGPGSNQPPGQATTTESSEGKMDTDKAMNATKKKGNKTAKKMKKKM